MKVNGKLFYLWRAVDHVGRAYRFAAPFNLKMAVPWWLSRGSVSHTLISRRDRGLTRRFSRSLYSLFGSLFRLRVSLHLGRATFPAPRRTQHADFPHCALLFASASRIMGPILPERLSALVRSLGSHRTASESDTAIPYSTAPSRSPVGSELAAYRSRLFVSTQSFTKPKHSLACPTAK